MRIIQPANQTTLSKVERFFWDYNENLQYKIAKYVVEAESEDGKRLLYNVLTRELIEAEPDEDIFNQFFLMHLYIVPVNFREEMISMLVREIYESQRTSVFTPKAYTILTTTACNARCFYCYEKDEPKHPMTEKTAMDVADFIAKNYEKYGGIDKGDGVYVVMSWFGGEPLFRKKCIDIICNSLAEKGVPYGSTMISNGYLFDEKTIETAKNLWHLKNVQITIDGTKDVYNKTKAYIYKDDNPFETVLNNISRLSENGVAVSIRINVGMFNIEDVELLINELVERFQENKMVSVYLHNLFDAFNSDMRGAKENEIVFTKIAEFERRLNDIGMCGLGKGLNNSNDGHHCMADSENHLCILTDGRITMCEHFINSGEISTIYDFPNKIDYDMVAKYKEIREPLPQCYDCPMLSDCSYLKICADNEDTCTEARKQYILSRLDKKIKLKYKEVTEKAERLKTKESGAF